MARSKGVLKMNIKRGDEDEIPSDEDLLKLSNGLFDRYYPPEIPSEEAERIRFATKMISVFEFAEIGLRRERLAVKLSEDDFMVALEIADDLCADRSLIPAPESPGTLRGPSIDCEDLFRK